MKLLGKISELHVKSATLFTKIEDLSDNVSNLATDLRDTVYKVGRLEGAVANSNNPEVLRQISEIKAHLSEIEVRLVRLESRNENEEKKLKKLTGPSS